jgi:very-short-patch-repair endonuclease
VTKNNIINYNPKLKSRARELRKNSTLSEVLLWHEIKRKALGYEFHRQVPIHEFIVDFYCHELRFAIEIDGDSHGETRAYDEQRQVNLEKIGINFIRFFDIDVKKNLNGVLIVLKEKIKELTSPLPPSKGEYASQT